MTDAHSGSGLAVASDHSEASLRAERCDFIAMNLATWRGMGTRLSRTTTRFSCLARAMRSASA